jgi:hypothetical protein
MKRAVFIVLLAVGCGGFSEPFEDTITVDPIDPLDLGDRPVPPYSGADPHVLEAQATLATGNDFHRKVIQRSCSPTEGVCHNRKEYPDLHTPTTFASNIGAPCNQVPRQFFTVFDRCEAKGDRFRINDNAASTEIAYIEQIQGEFVDYQETGEQPTAASPGLHIYLRDVVVSNQNVFYAQGFFLRDSAYGPLTMERFETRYYIMDGGRHLFAEVRDYQRVHADQIMNTGLYFGDHNRNGIFGASQTETVALMVPGDALKSYLVARLRGHMDGQPVPGTRMPLANQVPTIPEMVALACFIEGLPLDGGPVSMAWPINYEDCSWNTHPDDLSLTGSGAPTWSGRVWPLLQANCGGCHNAMDPPEGLDLIAENAWLTLMGASKQQPALKLIEPGDAAASYLYRKVTNTPGITGDKMPPTSNNLTAQELADIEAWIADGALN